MITPREVEEAIASCTRCGLACSDVSPVPFRGPAEAPVAVIAEAPGKVENDVGKPLVGPAGQLLDQHLEAAGLDLSAIMYFNVVSCWPKVERTPTEEHIAACRVNLEHQLLVCQASHVLLLGRIALQSFQPRAKITALRGTRFEQDGKTFFIALHPSAILRNPEWKQQWVADLEAFARLTKEAT